MFYHIQIQDPYEIPRLFWENADTFGIYSHESKTWLTCNPGQRFTIVPMKEFFTKGPWEEIIKEVQEVLLEGYHIGVVSRHSYIMKGDGPTVYRCVDLGLIYNVSEAPFLEAARVDNASMSNGIGKKPWNPLDSLEDLTGMIQIENEEEIIRLWGSHTQA